MKLFDFFKMLKGETGEERFDLALSVKKAFTTNITAKLLCVFAALCLWFYVMGTEGTTFERTFKGVEVTFSKNINGLQILSSDRLTVDVVLSGKRSVLNRMDVSDINATVDISNISKTGTDTFAIKVTTSNDTSVEGFSPRSVELHLDEPFSKTISVEADYRGGTSDSDLLTIGKIVPSKKNVVISGPKDSVSKVAYAKAMVELNFISHSVYIENVDLDLYDTDGNKIDNSFIEIANGDDTVDVDVDVHMKKELPVVPKFLHGIYSDDALSLKLTPATVVVKGEVSAVKNLTEIFTETIDEKELDIKSNSFKVSLEKAPDVAFVGSDDECSIVASVKNYAEKNIYIPAESVVISNIPEGRAATIHEKGITITVCGIDSVVSQITAYDLSFEIRGDILNLGINPDIPVYVKLSNDELHNVYIRNPDQRADIELK